MYFVGMSFYLSIVECEKLYYSFIEKMFANRLKELLELEGNLYKNGKRKKTYYDKGKKHIFYIQRMVLNKKYYFDLFPIFLIPNSTSLLSDVLRVEKGVYKLSKRRFKTNIERILEKTDLYNLDGYDIIFEDKKISVYRSHTKHYLLLRKSEKTKHFKKEFVYVIYLKSSAQTSFS